MRSTWLFDDNLRAFLTVLSWEAQYDIAPEEYTTIEYGVRDTDAEENRWYEYEFAGRNRVVFSLATDPGTSVVHVRYQAPTEQMQRIDAAISIFAHFHFQPPV